MKTLLYAPAIYRHDRGLQPPTMPSCFYYRWQCNLLKIFDSIADLKVIWKAGPRTSNLADPMRLKICGKRIRYSTRKLSTEFRKCDFVFVDIPSTPMFEAMQLGKPVLCITSQYDSKYIRGDFVDVINLLIFWSNNFWRIEQMIKNFLKGPINYVIVKNIK